MPWVSKTDLTLPTLAMINEFDKVSAIKKVFDFDYDAGKGLGLLLHYDDWAYLFLKYRLSSRFK